jgi:hypothetical protein
MKIFAERDLGAYLDARHQQLATEVTSEEPTRFLNMNQTQYMGYLVAKYQIEPLQLHWDQLSVTDREEMIPAEYFPGGGFAFNVERGRRYEKQVITYHIPFEGTADLLRCRPSTRILWTTEVQMNRSSISFDVVNFSNDSEDIKREARSTIDNIKTQCNHVIQEIEKFNNHLEAKVASIISSRKAELLKRANLVASLGVPVQRTESLPPTFMVPISRKTIAVKPTASSAVFKPEPAVPDADYREILEVVSDLGINMERLPSIYSGKGEEELRDLFIMQLSPHFASVTGETFNKSGKTDILIRHEGTNVFVAECKFWHGAKAYLATIDQILSYLTWRDSKAAIICFVQNRELHPVLEQIDSITRSHSCFVKHRGTIKAGWFQFDFHMQNDPSRQVFLAVLCFHLPAAH